eukprot:evm.model.scf_131.7 EVM.evm.TU.scf_131.7   scf_131:50615-52601(+)
MAFKLPALLLLGLCATATNANKTKVTLYEEALCPFCRKFVAKALEPLFDNGISALIDLRIVASGNARKDEEGEIVCQHGPVECLGNRIINCAIDMHPAQDDWFPLVLCLETMGDYTNATAVEDCARRSAADAGSIMACAEGARGKELVERAYAETWSLVPQHTWVPWVVIDELPMFDAGYYVQTAVCLKLPESDRPESCYKNPFANDILSEMGPRQQQTARLKTAVA